MFNDVLKRFVILVAFAAAALCLIINLFLMGNGLLYSAFVSFCVMLGVAIILLFAAQSLVRILVVYLYEQKRLKEEQEKERKQLENGSAT